MAIRLNSIPASAFEMNAAESNGNRERALIVASGRLLMKERNGRDFNKLRALEKRPDDYTPVMDDALYAKTNENTKQKMMLFAAKMLCSQTGEDAPENYEAFLKTQRRFLSDRGFLKLLEGIVKDILTPVLPSVMSNALDWLCETVTVPFGETRELDIMSNQIIVFEDDSWGASRSKPAEALYSYPITINPKIRTARFSIKWYQMVANDADLGRFFNSIAAGMANKIVALWNKAMVAGAANSFYMPSGLTFVTNNSANWISAVKKTAMVNGTSFRNIIAYGDLAALTKALPSSVINTSTVNLDAALTTMLGIEWAKYGYLAEYMGAKLMPIENVVMPGTQNTTVTELLPTDTIYFGASTGYKPVYVGIEEGTPITLTLDPSETADNTIDGMVSISIDAVPTFANKIAKMTV